MMEKETNKPTSHFPFPPSAPFAMGVPFPMFHPQMGQFIPMGMMPVSNMQHFMGTMPKSSVQSMSMSESLNSEQQFEHRSSDSMPISERMEGYLPSNPEHKKNLHDFSPVGIDDKKEYASHLPPMFPMMPQFVVFPYFSGIRGYVPGYPKLNARSSPKSDIMQLKDLEIQQHNRQQDSMENNNVESGSDELDVAQILVNMHVPFLKQETSSVQRPDSADTVNHDQNSMVADQGSTTTDVAELQKMDSPITQNDEGNFEVDESFDEDIQNIEMTVTNESGSEIDEVITEVAEDHANLSEANLSEVKTEDADIEQQIIEEIEETSKDSENDVNVLQVEIKRENENGEEILPETTENENEVCAEEIPPISSNVSTDLQDEHGTTKHYHELQCAKSEMIVCSQPSIEELPVVQVSCDINPSTTDEESNDYSNVTTANNSEQVSLEEDQMNVNEEDIDNAELSNDDPGGLRMTYKCDVCSQLFRSPLGLQKHIEFHTDDGKHYTCSICFDHFQSDTSLQAHLDSHMRKRPHKCSFCPKAFRDPGSLQKHVRVHTGEKPYNCKDCCRSFAEYSSLRKHQRVHTGEQPYKCQYCSKAFSISGNLQRHILIHTGERPYKCNFCPKAFNNPSHLRRHVKNLHFKGDSFVDEAMLSHYGNPGLLKTTELASGDVDEATTQAVLQDSDDHELSKSTRDHKNL